MKLLFLTEYFYPFAHGGSEWSVYYLARDLIRAGHEVFVLTPDYGSRRYEKWKGMTIYRFPFPVKLNKKRPKAVTPVFFRNPFFYLISTVWVTKLVKKHGIKIVHAHGNYFLPSLFISSKLVRIKTVFTARDYQVLCPYGFCLEESNGFSRCHWRSFVRKDFKKFLNDYVSKPSFLQKTALFLMAVYARLNNFILQKLIAKVDKFVCISKKQALIFKENGFAASSVIYNSVKFEKQSRTRSANQIFYAGRLTPGKGIMVLVRSYIEILKSNQKMKLIVAGDGLLKNEIRKIIRDKNLKGKIILLQQVDHEKVLQQMEKSKLVIVPSLWEEPFGRVALEAQLLGVPVIASNRGALPEIVNHKTTGYVVKPTVSGLTSAIKLGLKNNLKLRKNLKNELNDLQKKFGALPSQDYFNLYNKLCN